MSKHNWRDSCQCWLLDSSLVPLREIHSEVKSPKIIWKVLDESQFSCSVPVSSQFYGLLDLDSDQFLYVTIRPNKGQVFAIENIELAWNPRSKKWDLAQLSGRGGCAFFIGSRIIQPDLSGARYDEIVTGKVDDNIKAVIRNNCSAAAYLDPDGASRAIAGLTVAIDKTQHPDTATYELRQNLWEALRNFALTEDVDITCTPTWNGTDSAITQEIETYYPRRGSDKSAGQANPVILSDVYQVLAKSSWHLSKYAMKTHLYDVTSRDVHTNAKATGRFRKEAYIHARGDTNLGSQEVSLRAQVGHTFTFVESDAFQLGVDFWLGDKISHYDSRLRDKVVSEDLTAFEITWADGGLGSETIALNFGAEKPKSTDRTSGGGGGGRYVPGVPPDLNNWALWGDAGTLVAPDNRNAIGIVGGANITVTEAVATYKLTIAASTPAHTHGLTYTSTNTDAEAAHTHGLTYTSTNSGAEAAHTHTIGNTVVATTGTSANHTHPVTYTTPCTGPVCHTHAVTYATTGGNTSTADGHYHTFGVAITVETVHTHIYAKAEAATGTQSADHTHNYTLRNVTTGAGSSHLHTYNKAGTPTGAGSSHHHHYDKTNTPTGAVS